jgi:hypothetical protein
VLEVGGNTELARSRYNAALTGPAKLIDSGSARDNARERLDALSRGDVLQSRATKLGCSRYIPTAATTISVDCAD